MRLFGVKSRKSIKGILSSLTYQLSKNILAKNMIDLVAVYAARRSKW